MVSGVVDFMLNKKINILISTYNGEKYIGQQIESILSQSYQNFHIFVRDDCSSDKTVQIVSTYINTGKVTLYADENIGFSQSFMKLLLLADTGDFWAFCDQDDVWLPDKLLWALEWMESQDMSLPCLFHSAFENVDADLKHLSYYTPPKYKNSFQRTLTECRYFGFSMVINSTLRELMLRGDPQHIVSHDWWAQLIAVAFGKCEFDSRIASKHRRHLNSITLDNNKNKMKWLKNSIKERNIIANNAEEFETLFAENLSSKDRKLLHQFTQKKFGDNLMRAFYSKRWRPSLLSEVALRGLMLFGKS